MFRRSLLLISLALVAAAAFCRCGGGAPDPRPLEGKDVPAVDYGDYEALLTRYLDARGRVDYERWKASGADVARLDRFLGALRASPPGTAKKGSEALAYWLNLYNAIVIREVLRRWPLESVRDVRSGLLNGSLGFFRGLEFQVGDTEMTLDDIEHRVIREQFSDARIHFALNCGAKSCPPLEPLAFSANRLERELDRVSREFLADRDNFSVDHEARTVYLSKLFDWYDDDFEDHAQRAGKPATVLAFIELVATTAVANQARTARTRDYRVRFRNYDWSVNRAADGAAEAKAKGDCKPAAGSRLPDLSLARSDSRVSFPRARPVVIDVWATYCKPCRQTLPALAKLAEGYPAIDVITLSVDDDEARVAEFVTELPVDLPTLIGGTQAQEELGVATLPTLIALDPDGTVRACIAGVPDETEVEAVLRGLEGQP